MATTTKTTKGTETAAALPAGPQSPVLGEDISRRIEERVHAVLREALTVELPALQKKLRADLEAAARTTPRTVFNGDDAIFLAYLAGYTAGAHSANPHDKAALEIFTRSRGILDKLAGVNVPSPGGNPS